MIGCLDVDYRGTAAVAAAVWFKDWTDSALLGQHTTQVPRVEPYQPGQFFRRELPCLLAVLEHCPELDTIVVDGHVWLAEGKPGLGAYLWEELSQAVTVVGVAKNAWKSQQNSSSPPGREAIPVFRGQSQKPLWVTAAGSDPSDIAARVQSMPGNFRLPTQLKDVDALCRGR